MTDPPWPVTTGRLTLRLHSPPDLDWLLDVHSRPDVARYLLDGPWTPAEAEEALEKRVARTDLDGPAGALALVVEREGTPVGTVALWLTDHEHRVAEIGWTLDPRHTGRGYAREAVRAVLRLGFERYSLHRVVAQMDARNTASARLCEAVGMRREAHHLQDWWCKGEWTDTLIYALLGSEVHRVPR